MKPTNGGRMCEQCSKTVVDFSKKNWNEIEEIQQKGGNSICGKYNPKQIEHWGMQVPSSIPAPTSRAALIAASAVALTLGQVTPSESHAQTLEQHQTAQPKDGRAMLDSLSRVAPQPIVIEGMVNEKLEDGTLEPLIIASVFLLRSKEGVPTNFDGEFKFVTNQSLESLKKDTLVVSFIGFTTHFVPLNDFSPENGQMNIELKPSEFMVTTAFYVEVPSM
ncbi:MAG: carboxypeptidase-like regulatory domain-containing protein [Flavobacteriales bacterium]